MKQILLKLENGLRVCLLPNPGVESVAVYLKGLAGSNYETLNDVGTAHFLEHLVLKGTENFNKSSDLLKLVTEGGGKFIGVTSRDDVMFGTHTLNKYLEESLIFLSELFYKPLLHEKSMDEVKAHLKPEILRCYDNPEKLTTRMAYATLFPSTRLAKFNIGDLTDIENLSLNKIKAFYNRFYTNDRFVLVISGKFNPNDAKSLLKKYFNKHTNKSSGDKVLKLTKKPVIKTHRDYNFIQDYMRVDLEGFKTSDDQKYIAQVLAKYLSTTVKFDSQNNGYAYKTNVSSYSSHYYGFFSFFGVSNPKDTMNLLNTFKNLVKDLFNSIDVALLESSKKSIVADLIFALEKPSMRAEYYSDLLLHGRKGQNHAYEIEQIKKVDPNMVLKIAKKIFSQNLKITLISGKTGLPKIDRFL